MLEKNHSFLHRHNTPININLSGGLRRGAKGDGGETRSRVVREAEGRPQGRGDEGGVKQSDTGRDLLADFNLDFKF